MDSKQQKIESHIIGEALFNYKVLDHLRTEDFLYYRKEFDVIKECKGDQALILSKDSSIYKIQDAIVYLSKDTRSLTLWLCESTFRRTLLNVLNKMKGNTQEINEMVLIDGLITKSETQDVFDLIDFLPEYTEIIGLSKELLDKWVNYCNDRVKEIKQILNR